MCLRLLIVFVLLALPGIGQAVCTMQNFAGTYAVTGEGTVLMPSTDGTQTTAAPAAIIGVESLSNAGAVTGWWTANIGGQVYDWEIVEGKAVLNPDCTGTVTGKVKIKGSDDVLPGEVTHTIIAINREPKLISGITTKSLSGYVIDSLTWTRIAPAGAPQPPCSMAEFSGSYIGTGEGTVLTTPPGATDVAPVPMSWTFLGYVDPQGKWTLGKGGGWIAGGDPVTYGFASITTTVAADCTGEFRFTLLDPATNKTLPGESIAKLLVIRTQGKTAVKLLYTQGVLGKPITAETWTKIGPLPVQ